MRRFLPYFRALLIVAFCAVGIFTFVYRHDQASFHSAYQAIEAGNPKEAQLQVRSAWLHWPRSSQSRFVLGEFHRREGKFDDALREWGPLLTDSSSPDEWQQRASVGAARIYIKRGEYSQADRAVRTAANVQGRTLIWKRPALNYQVVAELWKVTGELALIEGDIDKYRIFCLYSWDYSTGTSSMAAPTIRELWQYDTNPHPYDLIESLLAKGKSSDESVVRGRVFNALLGGKFEVARQRLADAANDYKNQDWFKKARLDLAIASDDLEGAIEAMQTPPESERDLNRALQGAWFANRFGDVESERTFWEHVIGIEPGHSKALEGLITIALKQQDSQRVLELRAEKERVDNARVAYAALMKQPGSVNPNVKELHRLAKILGRRYDAMAWMCLEQGDKTVPMTQGMDDFPTNSPESLSRINSLLAKYRNMKKTEHWDSTYASIGFEEIAPSAGVQFTFQSGKSPLRHLPETMGSGVGLIDIDNDGFLDIYLVQGADSSSADVKTSKDKLFRNRGNGSFEDVGLSWGITKMTGGYGQGVAVADYDNDGDSDLFLSRRSSYALLRNDGDKFVDVTSEVGLGGVRDWPSSAAWADIDNDGDLDLYVCHYLRWDEKKPKPCRHPETQAYTYCAPLTLESLPDRLYRNDHGTFTDISIEAGIVDHDGRGLGVVAADFNEDGWIDFYVANDATANFLFINQGHGKFLESAHAHGVAGNAEGAYQGSMGIACGDLDGDGHIDLAVTNLYGESTTFYSNLGAGMFADRTADIGLAVPSRHLLGFGAGFFDVNNDGRLDLMTLNGHVNDFEPRYPYQMPCQLMVQGEGGRLHDWTNKAGVPLSTPRVGRAMAFGDLDNDGFTDAVAVSLDAPVAILRNRSEGGKSLRLQLVGKTSNRDAVGARIIVKTSQRTLYSQRIGGGSYQSASDGPIAVGLGHDELQSVEIRWPSGQTQTLRSIEAKSYRLVEGEEPTPHVPNHSVK